jgi:ABC-2 type transport system permease protein
MVSLLAIEWLKLKRYRTFWILTGLFLIFLPLWNFQVAKGFISIGGSTNNFNFLKSAYAFPQVWANLGFWGSYFVMFISMLMIILTTNEFGFRTHRQNIIDGWQRIQFFHAKALLAVLFSVAVTVYMFLLGVIFGTINATDVTGSMFSDLEPVGYFFLLSLNYIGFALFLSIWIKRSGLAIGLFILYCFVAESILSAMINHYAGSTPYGNLLPLQASDELLPFPLTQLARPFFKREVLSNSTYAMMTAIWCAIYYIAGRAILLKRDW